MIYRIDKDAIVILEVFAKKTEADARGRYRDVPEAPEGVRQCE